MTNHYEAMMILKSAGGQVATAVQLLRGTHLEDRCDGLLANLRNMEPELEALVKRGNRNAQSR